MGQILAAISAVRQFIQWGIDLFKAIKLWFQERKQAKAVEKMKNAEARLQQADLIEDEQTRLKEKAKAIRELQKALHP